MASNIARTGFWSNRGERGFGIIAVENRGAYQEVARRRYDFTLESDRKYRVRLLRKQGRLQMFLDGAAVLQADAPEELVCPILRIHGAMGAETDVIFIDNVEVRAPAVETLSALVKAYSPALGLTMVEQRARHSPRGVGEAIAAIEHLPRELPGSSSEVLAIGELLMVGGQYDRAVEVIELSLARGGLESYYYKSLGLALLLDGRRDQAAEAFEKSIGKTKLESADVDQWVAAYFLDRVSEADFLERAAREPGVTEAFAWYFIGMRREAEGKPVEAATAYRSALKTGEEHGVKRNFLHRAGYRLSKLESPEAESKIP